MKTTQRRIILQYYVLSCMFSTLGVSITSAIYTTFLMKNGLNLFEVNLVNVAFFMTLFLCEIPTGAFADVFGRKFSFVISYGFMSLGMFIYGSSRSFWGFVLAEVLIGVGYTFQSGAFQAWLVDSLRHEGYTGSSTRIIARENVIDQIGSGIGAVIGAYMGVRYPMMPWFIGSVGLFLTMVVAFLVLREGYFVRQKLAVIDHARSLWRTAVESFTYSRENSHVRFILATTSVQMFSIMAFNMFWQPFSKSHGVPEYQYGYIFTAMMVFLAIGSYVVSRFDTDGREKQIIIVSQILTGVVVIAATIATSATLALSFFILHEVSRGFWKPLKDGYLHKEIPSHIRASILSFCEVLPKICAAAGLLVSGWVGEKFGVRAAWVVSSVVLIVGAFLVVKNGKGKK